MNRIIGPVRSLVAMGLCLLLLGVLAPLTLYLIVLPWMALQPSKKDRIGPDWVSWIARSLVRFLRMGGATFEFCGEIDVNQPGVVIMNHQSILDIPPLIHIVKPRLPRFVVRARYMTGVPTVSRAVRFIGCISVDPRRDRLGAVMALKQVADDGIRQAVMVYPEGHRSRDGEILPFRTAGLLALLHEKPLPVWTVVNDGLWRLRTLGDTFFSVWTVRCKMRVVDCVMSPASAAELPAFIEGRRENMVRALAAMRAEDAR